MQCHTCREEFGSWEALARHILESHPYSRGTRWANEYVKNRRYRTEWDNNKYRRPEKTNWKTTNEPVQIQIINFFAELYRMQAMGFSDGEILTMVNLGKRKALNANKP